MTDLHNVAFLYIDDDPLSRQVMEMMMSKLVHPKALYIFEDSQDFLERVKALAPAPETFLLDIHVTPQDGFEMLRQLRAEPAFANARMIAVTASVMNEEVELLKTKGFDGTIAKPLNLSNFVSLLQQIVDGHAVWHTV